MNNIKTVNVNISSFTFDSLASSTFASIDANYLEAACAAYSNAARAYRQNSTPDTEQMLEDAKASCEGVVRLYNIKQELNTYYNAPKFDAFFRLGLIPQKSVKFGTLTASVSSSIKKPSITTWMNACTRSGVEIEHKSAYNSAIERFVALLQSNIEAQVCSIGKVPTKKELTDALTNVAQACGLVTSEGKPLMMTQNAALAIAHSVCRADRRDIRGLKPVTVKSVEELLFDAVGGQLLKVDYHINSAKNSK